MSEYKYWLSEDSLSKKSKFIFSRDQNKVMMQLREPRMMANIWSSGKIVCQGARSEDDAKIGSRKYVLFYQSKF